MLFFSVIVDFVGIEFNGSKSYEKTKLTEVVNKSRFPLQIGIASLIK